MLWNCCWLASVRGSLASNCSISDRAFSSDEFTLYRGAPSSPLPAAPRPAGWLPEPVGAD